MEKEKERFCDICGNTCNAAHKGFRDPGDIIANEYAVLEARWGYCSDKDLEHHRCRICESCFDTIVFFIKHILKGKVPQSYYSLGAGYSSLDIMDAMENENDDTGGILEPKEERGSEETE